MRQTSIPINDFSARTEYFKMCGLKTNHCNIISNDVIESGIANIDRNWGLFSLMAHVGPNIAEKLESGTFEFAMIKTTLESCVPEFVNNIYSDKIRYICENLDPHNIRINNTTLKKSLNNGDIDPYYVAFLSPEQIHPLRWKEIIDKQMSIKNRQNDIKVTNIYKCYKCGSRETKTSQMQTRSADEPMTIFVTCLVCSNTFKK